MLPPRRSRAAAGLSPLSLARPQALSLSLSRRAWYPRARGYGYALGSVCLAVSSDIVLKGREKGRPDEGQRQHKRPRYMQIRAPQAQKRAQTLRTDTSGWTDADKKRASAKMSRVKRNTPRRGEPLNRRRRDLPDEPDADPVRVPRALGRSAPTRAPWPQWFRNAAVAPKTGSDNACTRPPAPVRLAQGQRGFFVTTRGPPVREDPEARGRNVTRRPYGSSRNLQGVYDPGRRQFGARDLHGARVGRDPAGHKSMASYRHAKQISAAEKKRWGLFMSATTIRATCLSAV